MIQPVAACCKSGAGRSRIFIKDQGSRFTSGAFAGLLIKNEAGNGMEKAHGGTIVEQLWRQAQWAFSTKGPQEELATRSRSAASSACNCAFSAVSAKMIEAWFA